MDGLRSFGHRSTAAPRKSRADFLVQQQVIAQLEHSALRSAEKSVVQPVLPKTSTSSSIRMARRKTRPEGVAERRGRKAWPEGVVGRRGWKAWSEGVAERRGRKTCLPESRIAGRTFGVQLMTVALVIIEYPDEAWVLIHSHAYSKNARACIITVTYNTVFCTFEALK